LHHAAWVTRDQEATRVFYEDVIGVPLVATWAERAPTTGREYCHTFYEMSDGSALAFFQWDDQDVNPIELVSPGHVAFECDGETQQAIKSRLEAAGYETRLTDHGYCVSLYVHDPNNLRLEFTVDHAKVEEILAERRRDAHETLARWLAGDHTPNNEMRH
jgi:catechol 2,3-dioxygenase-like lactoylglutathione lyase family enzyme